MRWNDIDERLRKLYNAVATEHGEGSSENTARKAQEEANRIMEELTTEFQNQKLTINQLNNVIAIYHADFMNR